MQSRLSFVIAAMMIAATVWTYSPALHGEFVWDDALLVRGNESLRSASGLESIWLRPGATPQYFPLVYTVLWIEYHLWRLDTFGYHLVNVAFHAANALLLYVLLARLRVRGAFASAAIFALHPVHVESVAWISELKNVLSGFFFLAALLAGARVFRLEPSTPNGVSSRPNTADSEPAGDHRPRVAAYFALLAFTVCALASKTVTCTLPAVLALGIWWRRGRVTRNEALALAPLLALGAAFALLSIHVERGAIGTKGSDWEFSALERILIAGRAIWFYIGKIVFPAKLAFIYPRWIVDAADWRQYVFPGAVALAAVLLWRARRRIGRGPLVALIYFIVVVSPALGFVSFYSLRYTYASDHFQYLASIGPICALTAVATIALTRRVRGAAHIVLVVLLAVLSVLARRDSQKYRNGETLWRDTVEKSPTSAIAHNNLGSVLVSRGRLEEAEPEFAAAARLDSRWAEAYNNWAMVLAARGRIEDAIEKYRETIRIRPDWSIPLTSLAWLYATTEDPSVRDPSQAVRLGTQACEATRWGDPASLDVLGAAFAAAGQFDDARRVAASAVDLARRSGRKRLAREIEERLALYEREEPAHGGTPPGVDRR